MDTVDKSILMRSSSSSSSEEENNNFEYQVLRCLQIGLLCVQEHAGDRPTMSSVVSMLVSDSVLAAPKQPAFIFKRSCYEGEMSTTSEGAYSVNEMSETVLVPR